MSRTGIAVGGVLAMVGGVIFEGVASFQTEYESDRPNKANFSRFMSAMLFGGGVGALGGLAMTASSASAMANGVLCANPVEGSSSYVVASPGNG